MIAEALKVQHQMIPEAPGL